MRAGGEVICAPGEVCARAACTRLTRCGDGLCEPEEDAVSCVDCRAPSLTDGVCVFAEIGSSDCAICGDGACDELEDERCPEDCADCGDGTCAPGERCRADCHGCGNGICDGDEPYPDVATHCPLDCLPCEPDRVGCFRGGEVTCAADGGIASYTPGACE